MTLAMWRGRSIWIGDLVLFFVEIFHDAWSRAVLSSIIRVEFYNERLTLVYLDIKQICTYYIKKSIYVEFRRDGFALHIKIYKLSIDIASKHLEIEQ